MHCQRIVDENGNFASIHHIVFNFPMDFIIHTRDGNIIIFLQVSYTLDKKKCRTDIRSFKKLKTFSNGYDCSIFIPNVLTSISVTYRNSIESTFLTYIDWIRRLMYFSPKRYVWQDFTVRILWLTFFNAIAILHFDETRRTYIDIWLKWHVNIVDISSTYSNLSLHVRKQITAEDRWHSIDNPIQNRVGWRSDRRVRSRLFAMCRIVITSGRLDWGFGGIWHWDNLSCWERGVLVRSGSRGVHRQWLRWRTSIRDVGCSNFENSSAPSNPRIWWKCSRNDNTWWRASSDSFEVRTDSTWGSFFKGFLQDVKIGTMYTSFTYVF